MSKRNKGQRNKDLRKGEAFEGKGAKAFKPAKDLDRFQQWVAAAATMKKVAVLTAESVRDVIRLTAEAEKIQASVAEARLLNHAVKMETAQPLHSDIGDAITEARVAEIKLVSEISREAVRGTANLVRCTVLAGVEVTLGNREVTSGLAAIVTQEMKAAFRRKSLMHSATEARLKREVAKAERGDEG